MGRRKITPPVEDKMKKKKKRDRFRRRASARRRRWEKTVRTIDLEKREVKDSRAAKALERPEGNSMLSPRESRRDQAEDDEGKTAAGTIAARGGKSDPPEPERQASRRMGERSGKKPPGEK